MQTRKIFGRSLEVIGLSGIAAGLLSFGLLSILEPKEEEGRTPYNIQVKKTYEDYQALSLTTTLASILTLKTGESLTERDANYQN